MQEKKKHLNDIFATIFDWTCKTYQIISVIHFNINFATYKPLKNMYKINDMLKLL